VKQAAGTLPFTGAQLGLFALVGLGLVAVGLLLHRTGREASDRS
jgi:LPXTG-motif cell wall-anchored protein